MEFLEVFGRFADAGGLFLLALTALYWGRVDAQRRVEEVKEWAIQEREDKLQEREDKLLMVSSLQENTRVLAEIKVLVERLNGKS